MFTARLDLINDKGGSLQISEQEWDTIHDKPLCDFLYSDSEESSSISSEEQKSDLPRRPKKK